MVPLCAKCDHQVDSCKALVDNYMRQTIVRVKCHGETDERTLCDLSTLLKSEQPLTFFNDRAAPRPAAPAPQGDIFWEPPAPVAPAAPRETYTEAAARKMPSIRITFGTRPRKLSQ